MFIHNLDPFIFDFGFFAVRWYSLAYIVGIFIGWWYGKKIISNLPEKSKGSLIANDFDDLIAYLIISMIIGGRIGYVIFYNPIYYFNNPAEILKIWLGGMSFHGGFIGVILAIIYSSKTSKIPITMFFICKILTSRKINVKILEKKLAHIKKPINLSIIGCVVNGPGEAAHTDIGITGGGKDSSMLYIKGVQTEKINNDEIITSEDIDLINRMSDRKIEKVINEIDDSEKINTTDTKLQILEDEKKIIEQTNLKLKDENESLKITINNLNKQNVDFRNELYDQKQIIAQYNIDLDEIEFLRLNLKFGHQCRKSFLNNDGFEVGTLEYKSCVMNKGQIND